MAITTYFCDLALDYVDQDGDPDGDGSGTVYTGPGGVQQAIEGWGNAPTNMIAGDILYLKGTADLSKFVKITVDVDKTGIWFISDVVQNHNDGGGASGDNWVGELVFIDVTALWVQINIASGDYSDVDTADGVDNTTRAETIPGANMTAKACPGIQVDNASGDTVTGNIHIIGCDASWVARAGQAVLDANSLAANCILNTDKDHWTFEYLTFQNATDDGYDSAGTPINCVLDHCLAHSNGSIGLRSNQYSKLLDCISRDNTATGISNSSYCQVINCRINDNNGGGATAAGGHTVFSGCLVYRNVGDNIVGNGHFVTVLNSVMDGSTGGSGFFEGATDLNFFVMGCRLTNNADHGVEMHDAVRDNCIEDYNVFFNNTNGDLQNIISGRHSYGDGANHIADPATHGYTTYTLLVTYDGGAGGGGTPNNASVGDVVTNGTWTAVLRTVPTGADTGTFELDTITGGNPANNDAITFDGVEDCDINGAPTIRDAGVNETNWNIKNGAENRSTEIDLFWD